MGLITKLLIISVILFCISSIAVSAHLDAGEDVTVNGYMIDFGYTPEKPLMNDKTILLFNLLNSTTNESLDPDHVWVRISDKNDVVFSGQFRPINKAVTFTFTFAKPGPYEVMATFYDNNSSLVQKTFILDVQGNQVSSIIEIILIILFTILLILHILKIRKFRRKK